MTLVTRDSSTLYDAYILIAIILSGTWMIASFGVAIWYIMKEEKKVKADLEAGNRDAETVGPQPNANASQPQREQSSRSGGGAPPGGIRTPLVRLMPSREGIVQPGNPGTANEAHMELNSQRATQNNEHANIGSSINTSIRPPTPTVGARNEGADISGAIVRPSPARTTRLV